MAIMHLAPPSGLDRLVQWEPSKLSQSSFSSGLDNGCRTIRAAGGGVWDEDDADRYFEQQKRIVAEARRRYGPLRVFFDVRRWVVENPQSALQFQAMNAELYRPEDRLVAVVNSSVLKQHPRVALGTGQVEVFISMTAAETWLQAYSADAVAA